jgi:hypothetical protein
VIWKQDWSPSEHTGSRGNDIVRLVKIRRVALAS